DISLKADNKNDEKKPKRQYPGFRKNFNDYIQQYTDYTGIQGFRYMGEQDRHIFEKASHLTFTLHTPTFLYTSTLLTPHYLLSRLSWTVVFCVSLWFCISLTIETWYKWETSPVLVSFARSPTPVWEIPFPAVTICPVNKIKDSSFNYTDTLNKYVHEGNLTEEEMRHLGDASLICDDYRYDSLNITVGLDTIDYLASVAPQFQETLFSCKWTLLNESCYNLFTPVLTDDGVCFSFNTLDRAQLFKEKVVHYENYFSHGITTEEWTLEKVDITALKKDTFPRRAMSAGSTAGLFLLITAYKQDLDYVCKGPVQGFKVLLHHPAELPRMSSHYYRAPLNQELVISITPDMMTTSPGLKDYDPHRRQCYFPDEKHLTYFHYYTQQNCQVECLTNYTLAKCGCVAYHMPREESIPVCGPGSMTCISNAEAELFDREAEAAISTYDSDSSDNKPFNCDCLPACTSLSYNAEITQADFHWQKIFEGYRSSMDEFPGYAFIFLACIIQLTRLTLYFKEQQFITSERNELYGLTDFLANCGGILGLFTGFSFLSLVEIMYFLSLRLICNVKMYGRHYWSASSDLLKSDSYLHY
ncbi:hypothetical protein NQ317_018753, partial [Molorchus minor]